MKASRSFAALAPHRELMRKRKTAPRGTRVAGGALLCVGPLTYRAF
jgi:hypothetical protein